MAPTLRPGDVKLLGPEDFAQRSREGVVIDTREPEAFAGAHLPHAYSVWLGGLPIFGGWVASREQQIYLCTSSDQEVDEAVLHLTRIGLDDIQGALRGGFPTWRASGRASGRNGLVEPRELAEQLDRFTVLDVREVGEFEQGHIPGAHNVFVGHLEDRLSSLELERAQPIAVTCGVGHRAGVAVSVLLRAGFEDVRNLVGGMKAWKALDLKTD